MTNKKTEALKLALEKLEFFAYMKSCSISTEELITALRERLVQPEPEPVAWHHHGCEGECIACLIEREVQSAFGNQGLNYLQRHINTTPKREWKGLTDAQIGAVAADIWGSVLIAPQSYQAFARAIEAKLKEKNT